MKILLDNNIPKVYRKLLKGHFVVHVADLHWERYSDGDLIGAGEREGFEVLITNDKRMYNQQNHAKRRLALVVVDSNSRKQARLAHDKVQAAVEASEPGSFRSVQLTIETS